MDWFKKATKSTEEMPEESTDNDILEETDEAFIEDNTEYTVSDTSVSYIDGTSLNEKLKQNFNGKIVRKDLTKKIKEGANVPVYVLEYLLGMYCSSDDESIVEEGVHTI